MLSSQQSTPAIRNIVTSFWLPTLEYSCALIFWAGCRALLDCIAAGLPTVANDDMAEAMDAPSYVLRVPDHPSPVLIAEALAEISDRIRDRTSFVRLDACTAMNITSNVIPNCYANRSGWM